MGGVGPHFGITRSMGNSKILHENARNTILSERGEELSVGPTIPTFDVSDLGL